jgi:hypothetical protein
MAAAAPAQAQQGLFEAARQLELSKIPLFFGDPTKDHFTPETWLYRLEQARQIGAWNDANTAIYMNMSFRENAIKWRDGLHDMGINTNDWATLRAAFMRFYAPGATIRSCVANLDLKQGSSESVRDYGPRVSRVIHDIRQTIAPYVFPAELFPAVINGLQGYGALAANDLENAHMGIVRIGEQRVADLISIHIFVAGLKPYLRDKCVTRVFNTYYEAYQHATTLEHNMSDPKKTAHVSHVGGEQENSDDDVEELEAQVNRLKARIRNRQNKGNARPRGNTNNAGNNAKRDYSAYTCRYCNIKGHIQSVCRKRIAAGAPMVDAQGKHIRSVHEANAMDQAQQPQQQQQQPPAQASGASAPVIAPPYSNPFDPNASLNSIFSNAHLNYY